MIRIRTILELIRFPNLFTAVADVVAGGLFVGGAIDRLHALWPLAAASTAFYAGGMVLNDVFDANRDRVERPERPIPSGRISRRTAAILGLVLLIVGVAVCWSQGPRAFRIGVILATCIVGYDGLLKRTPLAPALMGLCRGLNLLLGMSTTQEMFSPASITAVALLWLYVASVTTFARFEAGATARSRLRTGWAGMTVSVFGLVALLTLIEGAHASYLLLVGVLLGEVMVHARRAALSPGPRNVQTAVRTFILGIVVFDACLVFAAQGPLLAAFVLVWLIPAILAARLFEVT